MQLARIFKLLQFATRFVIALLFGAALIWMVLATSDEIPSEIRGLARIVDGDSLEIAGVNIRISGIDAPELDQECSANGAAWACGQSAKRALADLIGSAQVHCNVSGRDKYRRLLALCEVDGKDIGKWMVTHGWAVSYGDYSFDEAIARRSGFGIRQGEFEMPQNWRQKSHIQGGGLNVFDWLAGIFVN